MSGVSPTSADSPSSLSYRGRFAPSPTGPLHLGSLLTALCGFVRARRAGGAWLLRIDDLDPPRNEPGATEAIMRTLDCYALPWDGAPLLQSQRSARYRAALARLAAQDAVFPCACSRKELQNQLASAPGVYPGSCRRHPPADPQNCASRVKVDGARPGFLDALQGWQEQDLANDVGDFIVWRRDGIAAYHLANVVDDADLAITEVVRGYDLIDSAPRQLHLIQRLGLEPPAYVHLPVIADAKGNKLSKQNLAPPVDDSRPAETLVQLLRLMRQNPPAELEQADPAEIVAWCVAELDFETLRGKRQICLS